MNARGIPSIQYTQLNQLEGLRRMQHARTIAKSRTKTSRFINITINPAPDPVMVLRERIAVDPCSVLGHRPAWLVGGGIACGICGAHL